ncbi:MAG TPA: SDR family oxidoreductase [Hyphomicrobiaceae bacterium]|nr:SDR family oxidoreductase [Hyphomicrobiaceae bacterium]
MADQRERDDPGFSGKAAIISGGGAKGSGIGNGRAAALLLAREGVNIFVVDRDQELAQNTVAMIEAEGGTAIAHETDVTKESGCRETVAACIKAFGRLDFLDNNVGISSRGSVVEEALDTWRQVMQVNVDAMFLMSKYAIPAMIKSGGGGAIVNVSSISALRPRRLTVYTTSKAAVIGLTRAMAVDHGPEGIRVNCVAPGPVYTPMVIKDGMAENLRAQRRNASALGIEGTGWDVGHAVRFLLSDHARYITGQTLVVDGGVTLLAPARESQAH